VGVPDERGVGLREMVAGFTGERLGRVVLAAMCGADRSGTFLYRLARRRDRDLTRPVLLLEGLAGAGSDGTDLRAPVHRAGYDDALRRNASWGVRRFGR